MPDRWKEVVSIFWTIPLHGKSSKRGQDLGARMDRVKQNRNGVVGIPRNHLEEKAKALAGQGEWTTFIDVVALLVFGIVLFLM